MPSLRQLEYLVALADTRHFRRAAEKAGVSQPTLSAQLGVLEQRLGAQLVERSRSSVHMTPLGKQVLVIGRRMIQDMQEIRDVAAGQKGELAGTVRLGLPPTIGPYLLPRVLPEVRHAYPNLKLYVREQVHNALPAALSDGVLDVILTPLPLKNSDFETVPIFREPLFVVVANDHPLASKSHLERQDLTGEAVLVLESGHQLHEQVETICDEIGARLLFDYEGTSLETLRQMVAMGMGISFLPGLFVKTMLADQSDVTALEFKGRSLSRTIGASWRRTSARESDYHALLSFVRQTVEREFPSFPLL